MSTGMSPPHFLTWLDPITQHMPTWFQQGGSVMWILLLLSIITNVIVLERLFFWFIYSLQKERFVVQECFASLTRQQKTEALLACQSLKTPALIMLQEGINLLPLSPKERMDYAQKVQINHMSRGQKLLRSAMFIAPILGVSGALLILAQSLDMFSQQQIRDTAIIIPSIAKSLIPLVSSVAILLFILMPQQLFRALLIKQTLHLENIRHQFNHICMQYRLVQTTPEVFTDEKEVVKQENKTVSEQQEMPYHYEFSDETGEVNVALHEQTEAIKQVPHSAIAKMYNQELSLKKADLYEHSNKLQ
ncbi:MotA/TolQ/ExbB proton channel family protein [Psychromonas arctica]|uniref:MotA/TolQ/ExbB proton channel family protein n=1 Tax=Psychromonas arctica TaxID=168275 RepID=UPI002FD1643D